MVSEVWSVVFETSSPPRTILDRLRRLLFCRRGLDHVWAFRRLGPASTLVVEWSHQRLVVVVVDPAAIAARLPASNKLFDIEVDNGGEVFDKARVRPLTCASVVGSLVGAETVWTPGGLDDWCNQIAVRRRQ